MSIAPTSSSGRVLHIRPVSSPSASADKIDELLKAASLDVQVCGDVYRGLARMCRRDTDRPLAVLVCTDELGLAELEFFSITARLGCGSEVYVYGDERSEARISRAIGCGAAGPVTEQVIRDLGCARVPAGLSSASEGAVTASLNPEVRGAERAAKVTDTSPAASTVPVSAPQDESPAEAPPGSTAAGLQEKEVRDTSVRVPWMRYSSTPARTPPSRRPVAPENSAAPAPSRTQPNRHEPLLTEEELRALIGDDIASIAPAERDTGAGDEAEETGGVP